MLSFTESLMTYALGRRVEHYDMPTVRQIVRDAKAKNYRFSAFISGVANSAAFRMGRVAPVETTTEQRTSSVTPSGRSVRGAADGCSSPGSTFPAARCCAAWV